MHNFCEAPPLLPGEKVVGERRATDSSISCSATPDRAHVTQSRICVDRLQAEARCAQLELEVNLQGEAVQASAARQQQLVSQVDCLEAELAECKEELQELQQPPSQPHPLTTVRALDLGFWGDV